MNASRTLIRLARSDEKTNGAWIPVLKELEAQASSAGDFNALSLTSLASSRLDDIAIACGGAANGADSGASTGVGVRCGGAGSVGELSKGQTARSRGGKGRGLELAL